MTRPGVLFPPGPPETDGVPSAPAASAMPSSTGVKGLLSQRSTDRRPSPGLRLTGICTEANAGSRGGCAGGAPACGWTALAWGSVWQLLTPASIAGSAPALVAAPRLPVAANESSSSYLDMMHARTGWAAGSPSGETSSLLGSLRSAAPPKRVALSWDRHREDRGCSTTSGELAVSQLRAARGLIGLPPDSQRVSASPALDSAAASVFAGDCDVARRRVGRVPCLAWHAAGLDCVGRLPTRVPVPALVPTTPAAA